MKVNTQTLLRAGEELRVQLRRLQSIEERLSEAEQKLREHSTVLEPHLQALREQRRAVAGEAESLRRMAQALTDIAQAYEGCEKRLIRDKAPRSAVGSKGRGRRPRLYHRDVGPTVSQEAITEAYTRLILPLMGES